MDTVDVIARLERRVAELEREVRRMKTDPDVIVVAVDKLNEPFSVEYAGTTHSEPWWWRFS